MWSKFAKWAVTKPRVKKVRTNRPMIETENYGINQVIKNPKNKFQTKFKYKTRRKLLEQKNNLGVQMLRKWNKASPLGKEGYASSTVAPKAALVAGGYFLSNKDEE